MEDRMQLGEAKGRKEEGGRVKEGVFRGRGAEGGWVVGEWNMQGIGQWRWRWAGKRGKEGEDPLGNRRGWDRVVTKGCTKGLFQ